MGRPAQSPGTWGAIRFERTPEGRVRARGIFRDLNGRRHEVSATAEGRAAAEERLRSRASRWGGAESVFGPGTTVSDLSDWWLQRLRSDPAFQPATLANYARDAKLVVRIFGSLELGVLSPALIEHLLIDVAHTDQGAAHRALGTLRRILDRPVILGVMQTNPADPVRMPRPPQDHPYALTADQADALRMGFRRWLASRDKPGPSPDPRVVDMIDLMLVLGIRIGELLALRQCDVRVTATPPRVVVGATLVRGEHGEPVWQNQPKRRRQTRELVLSEIAIDAFRPHLVPNSPGRPVFANRYGSWKRPDGVRRILHAFREECKDDLESWGIDSDQVRPHTFRRTLATLIAQESGVDRAKEQLGHASISTTERHYVMPPRVVGRAAAELMDGIFGSLPHSPSGDGSSRVGDDAVRRTGRDGTH